MSLDAADIIFQKLMRQDSNLHPLLPYHSPEVTEGLSERTLRGDECLFVATVPVKPNNTVELSHSIVSNARRHIPVHEVGVDKVSAVLILFIVRQLSGEDDARVVIAGDVRVSVLQDVGRHSGVIKRPSGITVPNFLIFRL